MNGLSPEQEQWVRRAWAHVDRETVAALTGSLVDIPSPTGGERPLAEYLAARMRSDGLEAFCQPLDDRQANAVGRLRGAGDGGDLLLYAPLDTAFDDGAADQMWTGALDRVDLQPRAVVEDGFVIGLGAENPKGYAACVVAAARAVALAGVPLRGDVIVGLGAGGMPTNAPRHGASARRHIGQGVGCAFMLEQGLRPDVAVIAKPGWAVAWEEVGLCWFRVTVGGVLGYAGTRHFLPYRNPIVDAARVIARLEEWFPEYTARNTSGLVAPQGCIGAIEAGWPHKVAFIPAACHLYVDLRVSPRTPLAEVRRQFAEAMERIRGAEPSVELRWEMMLGIPGTSTDPDHWIVRSATRAWEAVEGRPHVPERNRSGATDANILRMWGVPTARVGMPRPAGPMPFQGQFSMGVASAESMVQLVRLLVYVIVDTCTRPRVELGLSAMPARGEERERGSRA
jgi:acetylornithine deacetylase/succinyl-diaminopimelate desuccinylase-like protein